MISNWTGRPCPFLDHGATVPHPAAGAYVVDLQADEIATSELAVDREVEQGKISLPTLQLNPNPNGPLPARTGERRRSHNHTSPPRVPIGLPAILARLTAM